MIPSSRLRGLYVITDTALIPDSHFAERVEAALRGGARLVQYRDKRQDAALRERLAGELVRLCRAYGALAIINDDIELAARVGAHGVHLGEDDASLEQARARLGERAILGASCYNRLELARQAAAQGADYIAFGSFFPSPTKPEAVPAGLDLLREAQALRLPLCAIGGVSFERAAPLLAAGADMLAVISDVFAAADVEAAARRYAPLFAAPGPCRIMS